MVDEKQTTKEDDQGATAQPVNNDVGNQPEAASLVERAQLTAKRIEEATIRTEQALARAEEIEAKRILGGRGFVVGQEQKKEVDPKDYAKALLEGKILK